MNADSELALKRLREMALRAAHTGRAGFTRFLEPPALPQARAAAQEAGAQLRVYGGWPGAERVIAAFYAEDAPGDADFPLCCLALDWNERYASPAHRDLLGAVMGLGLERDAIGDIAPAEAAGRAYLFVQRDVADYVCANLESAGRASLSVAPAPLPIAIRDPEGTPVRVTVQSARLDAVLAAGLGCARSEIQRRIEAGLVKRNHLEERRGDIRLEAGDLLSVRGYGRLRVEAIDGLTRKGRIAMRLFKYTS